MEGTMNKDSIPRTDSIQELAQFWDTHDLEEYTNEIEEVTESVFEREEVLNVILPSKEAKVLEAMAKSRGVEPAKLIREWVLEKVQKSA